MSEAAVTGTAEAGTPGSQVVDLFPARKFSLFFCFILPLLFLALFCNLKILPDQ